MDRDKFTDLIDIFIRARNCQDVIYILKNLSVNGQFNQKFRERYPTEDLDKWYEYIKGSIDKCIALIEGKSDGT